MKGGVLIRGMTSNDFFSLPVPLCGPWKASRVRSDSAFIEWSNPGSPCRQVHWLSLCSLPIWWSTALRVVRTASSHCRKYNAFWPDSRGSSKLLWTTLNELTTKSVEDCNDIHNLSVSPAAAAHIVFPFGLSILMRSDSSRNCGFVGSPTLLRNLNWNTAMFVFVLQIKSVYVYFWGDLYTQTVSVCVSMAALDWHLSAAIDKRGFCVCYQI